MAHIFSFLFHIENLYAAKDMVTGIKSTQSTIDSVGFAMAPLAIAVGAMVFYFNKERGMERVISAALATAILGAAPWIASTIYSAFR